jgi:hypothetical protein
LNHFLRSLPEEDFYVSREAALEAYGRESLFNIVDMATGWKIDLICRKSRPFSVTEFERRAPQLLEGQNIFVSSAEDALLSKLEWAKMTESERQLNDAVGILIIQKDTLDREYVERWVEALDIGEQWQRAKHLAG